ncbi:MULTISPECIES: hypothetical protein [unclassified Thiocapsa]|uniref:hypothetical protein n=1 Tax=unclassified Thiocapsa TaxID=2641286 RepID=UPI0035B1DCBF
MTVNRIDARNASVVQGLLIADPQLSIDALRPSYEQIIQINRRDRRHSHGDLALIQDCLERIPRSRSTPASKSRSRRFA